MPRRVDVVLDEILQAIDGILHATAAKAFSDFERDWLLRHGVQRGLEIISEAARHVPESLLALEPDVRWDQIRAIGSLLRHEYHKISDRIIWTVVTDDLSSLRSAVEAIRRRVEE